MKYSIPMITSGWCDQLEISVRKRLNFYQQRNKNKQNKHNAELRRTALGAKVSSSNCLYATPPPKKALKR